MESKDTAPATGQHHSTLPVVIDTTSDGINPSSDDASIWFLDVARPRGKCIRYLSDARPGPGAGFWRTYGGFPPEKLSPYAIVGIVPGRQGVEIRTLLPGSGEEWFYEGSIDQVASDLHRAGRRRGCRADRQTIFWALTDVCNEIKRQQAARGAC